jgi:hypothetical protein
MKTLDTKTSDLDEAKAEAADASKSLVGEVATDFMTAFMLMLGMGAAHGEVAAIPHPGYWTAFLMIWGLQAIAHPFKRRP